MEIKNRETLKKRILYLGIFYGVILLYITVSLIIHFAAESHLCPFKAVFDITCPMCGMSRAAFYLVQFKFKLAFQMHPLIFIMPILAVLLGYLYIFKNKNLFINIYAIIGLVLLFTTVYVLRITLNCLPE